MSKVYFESRDEAYKFCEEMNFGMNHDAIMFNIALMHKKGYIRYTLEDKVSMAYEEYTLGIRDAATLQKELITLQRELLEERANTIKILKDKIKYLEECD